MHDRMDNVMQRLQQQWWDRWYKNSEFSSKAMELMDEHNATEARKIDENEIPADR